MCDPLCPTGDIWGVDGVVDTARPSVLYASKRPCLSLWKTDCFAQFFRKSPSFAVCVMLEARILAWLLGRPIALILALLSMCWIFYDLRSLIIQQKLSPEAPIFQSPVTSLPAEVNPVGPTHSRPTRAIYRLTTLFLRSLTESNLQDQVFVGFLLDNQQS